jgi:3-oxoacyl-[acyl-carrier-protein] synthase II
MALRDARIPGEALHYINAHGTSTLRGDSIETKGLKRALGTHAYRIPVTSHKSMIGHSIGASSAISTGVTALTVSHGVVTPTINLDEADEECDLDYVPGEARNAPVTRALTNAFGFGGHNCCLVLGR